MDDFLNFFGWFKDNFLKEVKSYCSDNDIPFNILLIIDNELNHPYSIVDSHPNVKILFLPLCRTTLIQQVDQIVISALKSHYFKRIYT